MGLHNHSPPFSLLISVSLGLYLAFPMQQERTNWQVREWGATLAGFPFGLQPTPVAQCFPYRTVRRCNRHYVLAGCWVRP